MAEAAIYVMIEQDLDGRRNNVGLYCYQRLTKRPTLATLDMVVLMAPMVGLVATLAVVRTVAVEATRSLFLIECIPER